MLSRQDVRAEQIRMLLDDGFLPISVDYRLCPETTLIAGPMTDVADAFIWIRETLPNLTLSRKNIRVDGKHVVAVGWSTGGHLAMTLAWTVSSRGFEPPNAILAFYCPSDYEDKFWQRKNIPYGSDNYETDDTYELDEKVWAGISETPLAHYTMSLDKRPMDGWMDPRDSRSRLALWMNWHGQTLNVLCKGMKKAERKHPGSPSASEILAISPLHHIKHGTESAGYRTPTFIIHPKEDDLIPWQQAERTWSALRTAGIDAELRLIDDAPHLFDMGLTWKRNKTAKRAVEDGYAFLKRYVAN